MTLDLFVIKEGKSLRCGYTTGSCATAASKAAAIMLNTKEPIDYVEIDTPAGIRLKLEINNIEIGQEHVTCSVVKDGGDDPDSTDGMEIYSRVSRSENGEINIDGGEGIGRIMRKGLFGQVGQAAINPVPRQMIKKELEELSSGGYNVEIFAPRGLEVSKKTFNANIGIKGGISIIGTKGIVYPMSEEALLKTIYMEMDMAMDEEDSDEILLVPGNYGEKIAEDLKITIPKVKISNFVGDSLLYAYNKGFKKIKLVGHIGKFAKLAIGVFNTHSKVCDARMEAFVYYLALMGADVGLMEKVDSILTAEEALSFCIDQGYGEIVDLMERGAEKRIRRYLKDPDLDVEVIIYSMERGVNI